MTEGPGGPRVLVVDDTAPVRTLIHRALTAHGFRVDEAATLSQAGAMGPGGYDAIIVDAHLGAERGTDLVEILRAEDPAAAGRCLVISGGSLGGVPEGAAFLPKPFRPHQLVAAVRALTERPGPGAGLERVTPQPTTTGSRWPAHISTHSAGTSPREGSRADATGSALPARPGRTPSAPPPRTPTREPRTAPQPASGTSPPAASGTSPPAAPGTVPPAASGTSPPAAPQAAPRTGQQSAPAPPRGAGDGQAWRLLAIMRRLRARERAELADQVHDGPIQELSAASLAADLMRGQAPAPPLQRLDDLADRLAAAGRALRRLVDADRPFLRAHDRPEAAVRERTAWLLAEPTTTEMPASPAALTAAEAEAVADVAELGLLAMAAGEPPRAHIEVRAAANRIEIGLTVTPAGRPGPPDGDPGAARALVGELACALGATADTEFGAQRWRARITVPRAHLAAPKRGRPGPP